MMMKGKMCKGEMKITSENMNKEKLKKKKI